MKRLLKDWAQVFIMTVKILIADVILPALACWVPAIGVGYVAAKFTSNEFIIFFTGAFVYIAIAVLMVLLVKRYEDKQKNSQKDTRK